ncbi:MAG: hypothetical protein JHC37_02575, partial [Campylobacteraceae bacterium]|nr:hypothetical protein [Campylobacteraceae bacterium]
MGWLDNMVLRSKLILLTAVMILGIAFLSFQGFRGAAGWLEDVGHIGKEASVRQAAALRMDRERVIIRTQTLSVYQYENDYNAQSKFSEVLAQREKSFAAF